MTRSLMACSTTFVLAMAGLAPTALAQHQAAPNTTQITSDYVVDEGPVQVGGVLYPTTHKPGAHVQPSLRGTTVVYDSIAGCTAGFSRLTQGPAAILDDGFFTPGPASLTGATISEIDFMVRPIVAIPTIFVRLTVWDTIIPTDPIVQSAQIFTETYQITGTAANTTPALYIFTADVTDFVIPDDDWAIEIAFLDATGNILPNAQCTTDFPNATCAPTQPSVGDNAEIWWVDNDLGTIIGDGIRYEPYDAAQAGVNQGDAIAWAAGGPSNAVCFTFRGLPNDPNIGACCLADFTCQATDQAGCDTAGGVFSGPGTSCSVNFCVPPPANDDCINATTITGSLPMTVSYDNAGASQDGPDDCISPFAATGPDNDVWFKWTADCTGVVRISTCLTTGTDDKLAVYEGSNCGDLSNQVACDDDGCSLDENAPTAPFESSAEFSVTQGTTYLIRMGNFPGEPGQDGSAFNLESVSCVGGPAFCDADWCQDGAVGVPDIFCFLSDWFAFVPAARNYGGTPGVPAIFAFLSIWFATGQGPCTP